LLIALQIIADKKDNINREENGIIVVEDEDNS
jgi:hypothetical protein